MEPIQISRSSVVDRVAEALRQEMYSGRLRPGTPLRESSLVESFKISRSTVREALQMLTVEGLLVKVPNKGVSVRRLTHTEIDDIFRTRRILEVAGVRAVVDADHAELAALADAMSAYEAAVAGGDPSTISEAHLRYHVSIVGLLGSSRLAAVEESLMAELRLALTLVDMDSDDLPEMLREHSEMMSLIRQSRVEEAVVRVERHLSHAKAFVMLSD
ncbi:MULTISPECIES: GntR family transcriptional regulator [unclassified Streptomyces]|uniref:GntR family transcriptional regulator n=1 Tax=unclassified Streptomyces TaxID=2593676 RepID=UPI002E22200F|nr:GntR family transcriptional regulator [Streptomyces sp. NBC_01023]